MSPAADGDLLLLDVGRRVAELRRERELTQEGLAERAGVSLKYLQRIEAGKENLGLKSLVKLAGALEVSVTQLFVPPASRVVTMGRPRSKPLAAVAEPRGRAYRKDPPRKKR